MNVKDYSAKKNQKYKTISYLGIILISMTIGLFLLFLSFQYSYTLDYDENEIDKYLNRTSELISQNSYNDTEKTQRIIHWERNLPLRTFQNGLRNWILRHTYKTPEWFIHIGKANCEEKAIIFEDVAKRTNLTYRKICIDGFIDPKNNRTENHRWTEVWLDGDWRIADSGFNLYYPKNNKSYFTVDKEYLIGHIATFDDNMTMEDITDSYVKNTSELMIKASRKGKNIKDADIQIKLNYESLSCDVVGGNKIRLSTNESGICKVNLGIFDYTNYTVTVNDNKLFYKLSGKDIITLKNNTDYLEIEVDNIKFL